MATGRNYKSLPSSASGLSFASSSSAWGYSSYGTLTEGLPVGIAITGITFMPDVTDTSLSVDTTCQVIVELYKGASDTLIAQIPLSYRIDTRVNHVQPMVISLQEPLYVEASVRVRARVADSVAAQMDAQNSIKVFYYEANFLPSAALNAPANNAEVTPTPTLEFTGTDAESDDVTYQVQIGTELGGGADPDAISLNDNFDDNSFDTSKWTNWGGANVQETNQRIELTGTTTTNYFGFESAVNYDLSGKHVFVQFGNVQNPAAGWNATPLSLSLSTGNDMYWYLTNGSLECWTAVGGSYTQRGSSITYDPDVHKFVRIREASGTTYFDWSTDGRSWTNHTSTSNPFAVTSLVVLSIIGTDATVGSVPSYTVDNYNFIPEATPLLDKMSASHAGFANIDTPADTDPFTSGERVGFTVQSGDALEEGEYQWRVRAKDPSGANSWGEWSSTRTISVQAGTTQDQTITGAARIEKTVDATIAGLSRMATTTDRTIDGASRITTISDATVMGVSRVTDTADKTITGTANVANTTDRTVEGIARISATADQAIEGLASLAVAQDQAVDGRSRIEAAVDRVLSGVARVEAVGSQSINGVSRVTATADAAINAVARLQVTADTTIDGMANIANLTGRAINGAGRITVSADRTIDGISRVQAQQDNAIDGVSRIETTADQTIEGTGRIERIAGADLEGIARVARTIDATVEGVAKIVGDDEEVLQAIAGVSCIEAATDRAIAGTARIEVAMVQPIDGRALLNIEQVHTIDGVARLAAQTDQTIDGQAHVVLSAEASIGGAASIIVATDRTISGRAAVVQLTKMRKGVTLLLTRVPVQDAVLQSKQQRSTQLQSKTNTTELRTNQTTSTLMSTNANDTIL